MSVHAGAERNVCIIKVFAETPQSTTNPSQTLLPIMDVYLANNSYSMIAASKYR